MALYWADDPGKTPTPAGHWAWILTDLLRERKADLATAAERYARLGSAMSDAFVASWRVKYQINLLRPVTFIQLAFDANWVPPLMETPAFPEYPSGHSVQSGAAAAVLEAFYGRDTTFEDRTHNDRGWGRSAFAASAPLPMKRRCRVCMPASTTAADRARHDTGPLHRRSGAYACDAGEIAISARPGSSSRRRRGLRRP